MSFMDDMRQYAARAAAATGIPEQVVLAQWALESGHGTSRFAKEGNNFGGIKFSQYSKTASGKISGSAFANYGSKDKFVDDYIRVMNLSYYNQVRQVGRTGDIAGTIKALGASPYDAGHYTLNGVQGGKLLNMLGMVGPATQKKTKPSANHKAVCPACKRAL